MEYIMGSVVSVQISGIHADNGVLDIDLNPDSWFSNDAFEPRIGCESLKVGTVSAKKALCVREIGSDPLEKQSPSPTSACVIRSFSARSFSHPNSTVRMSIIFVVETADCDKLQSQISDYKIGKASTLDVAFGKCNLQQEYKRDKKPGKIMELDGLIFCPIGHQQFSGEITVLPPHGSIDPKNTFIELNLFGMILNRETCKKDGIEIVCEDSTTRRYFQLRGVV
jgi:hypothetical protein